MSNMNRGVIPDKVVRQVRKAKGTNKSIAEKLGLNITQVQRIRSKVNPTYSEVK